MTADEINELVALLEKAPARPWLYRPDRFDDWGFIRGGEQTEYGLPVVALGRSGGVNDDHDAHRIAKTDPYAPASLLIVAAVNALPRLLSLIASQQERIAGLELTLSDFSGDTVKLHPIQQAGPNLVKPRLGGSIIGWAADEIAAARTFLADQAGG